MEKGFIPWTSEKLMDKTGYGAQSEIQHKVGLSQSKISELPKLVSLPLSVQDVILKKSYSGRDNFKKLFIGQNLVYISHTLQNSLCALP